MGDVTLRRARWTPEVFAWLEEVLTEPPGVVCLDWDETCASGDIGEALVAYLDPSGRALEDYAATLAEGNTLKAYVESLYVIAGYSPAEVASHCEKAVAWALESGLVTIRPEMQNLMEVATARGWEVWVVTASGTPVVQAFAGRYGLPAERVIGMDLAMEGGVYQPRLEGIATYRQGKADAIAARIGKPVRLAAGDTLTDLEMLRLADHGLVIGPRHEALGVEAKERGWAVQPIFEQQ